LHRLPRLSGLSCVQFPSTHAPADDRRFDWAAGIHTVPSTATPSAQKWNDIGADVIFAKKFKWPVFETVCRIFSEELRKRGYDDQWVQRWLELQIEGIRCLISEIEASGGGRDGNT